MRHDEERPTNPAPDGLGSPPRRLHDYRANKYKLELNTPSRRPVVPICTTRPGGHSPASRRRDIRISASASPHCGFPSARHTGGNVRSDQCASGIAVWCSIGKNRFGTVTNTHRSTRNRSARNARCAASWLNYVETFFSKVARSVLRRIRVASKAELADRIRCYIGMCNAAPVLPRWRYGIATDPQALAA